MGKELDRRNGPQSINIWLGSLRSTAEAARAKSPVERVVEQQKDDAILTLLAKLALHYWRPDFTAAQARQLYSEYLEDLREYAFDDIAESMENFRRNGENRFFPTCGQLRTHIETVPAWDVNSKTRHINERHEHAKREMEKMIHSFSTLPEGEQAKQLAMLPAEAEK